MKTDIRYLFAGTVGDFVNSCPDGKLIAHLERKFEEIVGYSPSPSEIRAWNKSLPVLADDCDDAGILDAAILIEATLPLTSERCDAIILGRDRSDIPRALVTELKSWSQAQTFEGLVEVGGALRAQPTDQVASYVDYFRDHNEMASRGDITIDGLAYLHGARRSDTGNLKAAADVNLGWCPLITRDERSSLLSILRSCFANGDGLNLLRAFLAAPIRQSGRYLQHVADEIEGQEYYTLVGQQLAAFTAVKEAADRAHASGVRHVIIVSGGSGTGKTVIATRLHGYFARRGATVYQVTPSKAMTDTQRKLVGPRARRSFKFSNDFRDQTREVADVLVCDETHRVRRISPGGSRPQLEELIRSARVSAFFVDDNQRFRPREEGSVELIRQTATRLGAKVTRVHLKEQFRAMGSAAYEHWVDRLLGVVTGGPRPWRKGHDFELLLADSPSRMETWLSSKLRNGANARMTAGFCWPWSDPNPDGTLVDDVVINDWRRPWDVRHGKKAVDAPSASFWALDPRGFGQVGCIYTAQGFDYDYGGVIIGGDMVWRDGHWVVDVGALKDKELRQKASTTSAEILIRNVYRVLLTRAMKGMALFSVDQETMCFLDALIPQHV